jgi:hypothetical protein
MININKEYSHTCTILEFAPAFGILMLLVKLVVFKKVILPRLNIITFHDEYLYP